MKDAASELSNLFDAALKEELAAPDLEKSTPATQSDTAASTKQRPAGEVKVSGKKEKRKRKGRLNDSATEERIENDLAKSHAYSRLNSEVEEHLKKEVPQAEVQVVKSEVETKEPSVEDELKTLAEQVWEEAVAKGFDQKGYSEGDRAATRRMDFFQRDRASFIADFVSDKLKELNE